ncbi:MAG: DUF4301 family protein [Desulfosudaceae bacterium]
MLTDSDLQQIESRGLSRAEIERQLDLFKKGVTVPELIAPCTIGQGIRRLSANDQKPALDAFKAALSRDRIFKFIPASGAATRMFKELAAAFYPPGPPSAGEDATLEKLYDQIDQFAFYPELIEAARRAGEELDDLIAKKRSDRILELLLTPAGLGLDRLPKGMIPFHRYEDKSRTAFEEHLAEARELFGPAASHCRVHFTVAPDHQAMVADHVRSAGRDEPLTVEFSTQQPSTDTIAAAPDNTPFRDENGRLVFRPGGHGALLTNLNQLEADLAFIKNIDNVAIAQVRQANLNDLKALCGLLIELRQQIFGFLEELDQKTPDQTVLENMLGFVREELLVTPPQAVLTGTRPEQVDFLRTTLDRPLRVCGVVRHEGEPGGGPFLIRDGRGNQSLQIIEAAQVDMDNPEQQQIWESSTHFNPVILACGLRDHTGRPFDLTRFADPEAGLITEKSLNGQPLKALEHPGLWNGAMAYWNTVFVELPATTFNPVKTVFDLLRAGHRVRQ